MGFVCKNSTLLAVCWSLSIGASGLLATLPGESPMAPATVPGQSWFPQPAAIPESPAESRLDFADLEESPVTAHEAEEVHQRLAESGRVLADKKTPPAVLKATWPDRRAMCAGPLIKTVPMPTKSTLAPGPVGLATEFRSDAPDRTRRERGAAAVRVDYFSIRNGYIKRTVGRVSFDSRPHPFALARFSYFFRSSLFRFYQPANVRPGAVA